MTFESIVNEFGDFFRNLKDNKMVMFIIVVMLSLYSSLWVTPLYKYTETLINNIYFKFLMFILITYITTENPGLGVMLAIAMLVTMQTVTYSMIGINLEKFGVSGMRASMKGSNADLEELLDGSYGLDGSDRLDGLGISGVPETNFNGNIYLSKPLLKEKELTKMGNNLNLKLQTPTDLYENMIKKGRILLDDSIELKNELKNRFDVREQSIANIAERDGNVLVKSGINRLQPSNNGEYNDWVNNRSGSSRASNKLLKQKYSSHLSQLSEKSGLSVLSELSESSDLSPNGKSTYIKYDRFMENYSDNEVIMDLFNLLKNKYNELTSNKTLSSTDFDNKLREIYDTELDLLVSIYDIKKAKMNESDKELIQNKIDNIKDLRLNKNSKYFTEITHLSQMIC